MKPKAFFYLHIWLILFVINKCWWVDPLLVDFSSLTLCMKAIGWPYCRHSRHCRKWSNSVTFLFCRTEFVQKGNITVKGTGLLNCLLEIFARSFLNQGVKRVSALFFKFNSQVLNIYYVFFWYVQYSSSFILKCVKTSIGTEDIPIYVFV